MRLSSVRRSFIVLIGGIVLGLAGFAVAQVPEVSAVAERGPTTTTVAGNASTTTGSFPTATTTTATGSFPTATGSFPTATGSFPTATGARERIVIHGVGDVNTDPGYVPSLAQRGPDYAWSGLGGLFAEDDLTVINLECTPSELGTPLPKEFVFRCSPESLGAMAAAGVEVVNLANNHAGDHGKDALIDGKQALVAAGLLPVGVGADAAEAERPALVEVGGWKIAVLGFGGVFPTPDWFATGDRAGMANGDSIEAMVGAVEAAAEMADLVIVTIHWGVELDIEPQPDDRERAQAMVEAGADVIFGHHSHRLQPLEMVEGTPVAWGLGNFVWPAFSAEGATTAVARVVVEADGAVAACLIPAVITDGGHPVVTEEPPC